MPKTELDAIDRRILAALQDDARLSNVELAELVGLSPSPCLRRVRRLEREGAIRGYRAVLARDRLGLGLTVFIGVAIGGHADAEAEAFQAAIVGMPEIVACHMVSGSDDYLLEVVVPDLAAYRRFLLEKLLDLALVKSVRSSIAIDTLKAGGKLSLDHLAS